MPFVPDAPTPARGRFVPDETPAEMEPPEETSFLGNLGRGVLASALKTSRGIGTTFLPGAAEKWAEQKGLMPSAEQITAAEAAAPGVGGFLGKLGGDVATEFLPTKKVMQGATLLRQALPRAAALGGVAGGVRAETEDLPREVALGAVGGALGEGVGRGLVGAASRLVKPSAEASALMRQGVVPTLGEGVETGGRRYLGKALSGAEEWLAGMPISGIPLRSARRESSRQLFNAAAELATPPGMTTPTGTTEEVIRQLRAGGRDAMSEALNQTRMIAGAPQRAQINQFIDSLSAQHGVSDDVATRLKAEITQKLWEGIPSGQTTANVIENVAGDLFEGNYRALKGNTNAQRVANSVATTMREWVNDAARQSGFDLSGARQSLATTHALSKATAKGTKEATGERMMKGVLQNDAYLRSVDSATRELRDLAEAGKVIRGAGEPMGFRTPQQAIKTAVGSASEAGWLFGGVPNLAGLAYGALNKPEFSRRLLMGDPSARAAARRALSPYTTTLGIEAATENENAP